MDGPREARANARSEFVEQIGPLIVLDGVDGVEAKPVEMKLLEPIFGVLDEEVAHRAASSARQAGSRRPKAFCAGW